MTRLFILGLLATPALAFGQGAPLFGQASSSATPAPVFGQVAPGAKPAPRPTSIQAASAFAVRPPDEGSPFFSDQLAARYYMTEAGVEVARAETVAMYPRTKNTPDSASAIFTKFFTDMFASVNLRSLRGTRTTQKLLVEPIAFSLGERREIDAVYSLRNNTGKIIRLDYPTSQRIEILTMDPTGKVIDRWSDDRVFKPQEGIVVINPQERIEYREKIPTRDMKANEPYSIQTEVAGYPDYTATRIITPSP